MKYFTFPREHGLIMIWSSSLLLGLISGIIHLKTPVGIVIAILFSATIILSYNSVKKLIDSKLRDIEYVPLGSLALASLLAVTWNFSIYSLIFFGVLTMIVVMWAIHYHYLGRRTNSYSEIILGSMALTLQFPIIFNLLSGIPTPRNFWIVTAIWWIFFGTAMMLILAVGCYRRKLPHSLPLIVWAVYLITVVPVFWYGHLDLLYTVLLIDPTVRGLYHFIRRPTLRTSRIPIKKVGWNLTFSMFLFVVLILLVSAVAPLHVT